MACIYQRRNLKQNLKLLLCTLIIVFIGCHTYFTKLLYNNTVLEDYTSNDGKYQPCSDLYDEFIQNNPVYKRLNVTRYYETKKDVTILVIVSTAPKRSDRRNSIRQTWWKECKTIGKVSEFVHFNLF